MIFYIAIFVILAIFAYFYKRNLLVYIFSISSLCFIAGFRGLSNGTDTHLYYEYFKHLSYVKVGYMEPIWNALNWLVISVGGDFNLFLLLVSVLTLGLVAYVLWKELDNPQFGLFVYYAMYAYCNSFNGMRQYLAISVVLLGFYFLNKNKNVVFIFLVFLASLIHQSAFLVLPVLMFQYLSVNRMVLTISFIITLIIGLTVFPQLDLSFLYGRYAGYAETKFWTRESISQTALLGALMNMYALSLLYTMPISMLKNIYPKIFFIGILIMNLTLKIEIMSRILLYFTIIQVLLIPLYLQSVRFYNKYKIINITILTYLTLLFFKMLILGNQHIYSIYPYMFMGYQL